MSVALRARDRRDRGGGQVDVDPGFSATASAELAVET
jgi:hypothetical protein